MMVVDSHHHVWRWNDVSLEMHTHSDGPIARDFTEAEFVSEAEAIGITDSLVVQTSNNTEETAELLTAVAESSTIRGVIGWLPLNDPRRVAVQLEGWQSLPLVGVRDLSDWSAPTHESKVLDSLNLLAQSGLSLDYLCRNLSDARRFHRLLDRSNGLRVILDHLANPYGFESAPEWSAFVADMGRDERTAIKISVGHHSGKHLGVWSASDIQPFVDTALAMFGPDRVMLGSNWPVGCLWNSYREIWIQLGKAIGNLSADEKSRVLGRTAAQVYGFERFRGVEKGVISKKERLSCE